MKIFIVFLFLIYKTTVAVLTGINTEANILGGSDASITDHPFQVFLVRDEEYICCGGIITNMHILTAAHCLLDMEIPYDNLNVVSGTTYYTLGGEYHTVRYIDKHPDFNENNLFKHDIAVITLALPIVFSDVQSPIKLASIDTKDDLDGYITGWGLTSYPSEDLSETLQYLDLYTLGNEGCQEYHATPIEPGHLCAYGGEKTGACMGDSGTPLIVNSELVGISSFVDPCGNGFPDVYTRVFYYKSFIESVTRLSGFI